MVFWFSALVLALPATFSLAAWWWSALAYAAPGRTGDMASFIDMLEYSDVSPMGLVIAALGGTMVIALIANAFLSVGALDVLVDARRAGVSGPPPDARRLLHRFFRGGGRFFLRSLGVLVIGLIVAAVAVGVGAAGVGAAVRPLDDAMSVWAAWTHLLLPVVVVGVLVVFFCGIVVDLARIELVRSDRRNPIAAYWRGLTLAVRTWRTVLGVWLLALVLGVALVAAQHLVAPARANALVAFFGIQLLFLVLGWLRVGVLGAEVELSSMVRPDPIAAPEAPPYETSDLSLREPEPVPEVEPPVAIEEPVLVAPSERKDS